MADSTQTVAPTPSRSGDGAPSADAPVASTTRAPAAVSGSAVSAPPLKPISRPSLPPPVVAPPTRAASKGKVARIADQTKGVVDDVKTWVDLRLALAKQEIKDEIDGRVATAKSMGKPIVALAIVGVLAVFFLLLTISFGFTALYVWWFASLHLGLLLGFLTMTVILGMFALVFKLQFDKAKARAGSSKSTEIVA